MPTRKITLCALYASLASIIGLVESFLPALIPFAPGTKLGLANVVSLLSLMTLSFSHSFWIVCLRVSLVALVAGQINSFIYSLLGGLISLICMYACKQLGPDRVSVIGISMLGGMSHNLGQLLVASFITKSWLTFNYLPFLSIAGLLAGLCTGLLAHFLIQRLHSNPIKKEVGDENTD